MIPIGWLRFPEAVVVYETTWQGERPSMPPDQASRFVKLWLRAKSEALTDPEAHELKQLGERSAFNQNFIEKRVQASRELLQQQLHSEIVASKILHRATGHPIQLPGRFWASDEAANAIAGQECKFYLNNYWWQGPVLISEADVIKAAAPSLLFAHAEAQQTAASSGTLAPLPDEHKQAYIMRTLQMPVPRRITNAEGRELAKRWLEEKKLPADKTAIEDEMKRMTAHMRMLAPKPKQTKAKPKAKPVRSKSE